MGENEKKYDLILVNNASKQFYLYTGLTDSGDSHLYHKFDIDIDAPDGEYTFVVVYNTRTDVTYNFKVPVLDTIVHVGDEEIVLRDLQPSTGLLRIGENVDPENVYDETSEKNNPTTFYYYDE
jgi:hypothetical protein